MINVVVVVSVVYYVMLFINWMKKIEEYVNRELKNHLEKAQDKFTNHLEWFWKGVGQQQAY